MLSVGASISVGDHLHPLGKLDESTYRILAHSFDYVESIEKYCLKTKAYTDVAIWLSHNSESDMGASKILQIMHLDFDVIESAREINGHKLIIIPDKVNLTEDDEIALENFHRAFDMTVDAFESLETLISLGVDRVLTSGQEATVPEGADMLSELVKRAGDRIIVMPGCGITERNFEKMKSIIKAKEYHIHLPQEYKSRMEFHPGHIYMGGLLRQSEFTLAHTSVARVQEVMRING